MPCPEQELTRILSLFEDGVVRSTTSDVLIHVYGSAIRQVYAQLFYGDNYPSESAMVELKSSTLPIELLQRLEQGCMQEASKHIGLYQTEPIIHFLEQQLNNNRLLACFSEVSKVKALVGQPPDEFKKSEKNGFLRLKVHKNGYFLDCQINIPNNYPVEVPTVQMRATNFPDTIVQVHSVAADDLCRRYLNGRHPHDFVKKKKAEIVKDAITVDDLHQHRHDQKYLKISSELKDLSGEKFARRLLVRLNKAESAREKEIIEAEQAIADKAAEALAGKTETCQPSIFPLCQLLVERFVRSLPSEPCQGCNKALLPTLRADKEPKFPKLDRMKCGHWYHSKCLDNVMFTPPFGTQGCATCGGALGHARFPEYSHRQRRWQMDQARQREIEDAMDFMS